VTDCLGEIMQYLLELQLESLCVKFSSSKTLLQVIKLLQ